MYFKILIQWQVTEECMYKGIDACQDGALFRKIGKKIRYICYLTA